MSEDDEIAMLHAMQQGQTQDGLAWEAGADEMAEGDEAEQTEETSEQPVKQEKLDSDDQPALRATSAASSDDGGYNPNASTIITSQGDGSGDNTPSRNPTAPKKKQVGAFVDDSDDDEEEDNATPKPAASALQPPAPAALSVSKSPLNLETIQESQRNSPAAAVDSPSVASATDRVVQESNRASEAPAASTSKAPAQETTNQPKARLPHDRVGILEDRIAEDPRGDIEAWLDLISEHQKRNKLEDARSVFERFFQAFPMAADIWVAYIEMELSNDNFQGAEVLFAKSLLAVPNVNLWSTYLNYVRRRNDLTNDASGASRNTIAQAYDFVLATIGMDREAGRIWQEYIQFIRQGPGAVGGTTWQDQQKMDQLRKAYQRAVCVPMANVNDLWKEYDQFEMSLNKITGRKFLQEKSPSYMTARSANTALGNITRGLNRTNLPKLPPAPGFEGDKDYLKQVDLWKQWINWEKEDPLVLRDEDPEMFKKRILYAYKQSIMALWFWPEMWVDAAEWAFANGMEKEGNDFLSQGINANPESCLLAFKQADRLEAVLPQEEGEEGIASRGAAVRAPYQKNLDALYELLKKLKARETDEIAKIQNGPLPPPMSPISDGDDAYDEDGIEARKRAQRETLIAALKQVHAVQQRQIQRTLSFSWIALMRAMRRVQGKGKVGAPIGGSRQILNDARLKGKITSDVYVASALIEHNVYKDPAGTKIFERGAKLFPEDEVFILEYLKHLLSIGDTTNARAVFETSVTRLASKPETLQKSKPLYTFFHKYESDYGELSQIARLETRMADLFPDDPKLQSFASRYAMDGFDPTTVRPIISPASQMKPKLGGAQQQEPRVMQSIEEERPMPQRSLSPRPQYRETSARPTYQQRERSRSPRPTYGHLQNQVTGNSPKRTHAQMGGDVDEYGRSIPPNYNRSDAGALPPSFSAYTSGGPDPHYDHTEAGRPRKLQRGESPLKGAAGRRLIQQKVALGGQAIGRTEVYRGEDRKEVVIPRDITFLLSIIPGAETYAPAPVFGAEEMVGLLRRTDVPGFREWKLERDRTIAGQGGRWNLRIAEKIVNEHGYWISYRSGWWAMRGQKATFAKCGAMQPLYDSPAQRGLPSSYRITVAKRYGPRPKKKPQIKVNRNQVNWSTHLRNGHIRLGMTLKVEETILDRGVYNKEQNEWVEEAMEEPECWVL